MPSAVLTLIAPRLNTGDALASGTTALTVQANTLGTRSFDATTALLDSTDIDPTSGADAHASTTIGNTCTKGTPLGVWAAQATATISNDTNTIDINLTYSGHVPLGTGALQTLTIGGTIPATNYATVSTGTYSDTVTLGIKS